MRRSLFTLVVLTALAPASLAPLRAYAADPALDAAMRQLDAASAKFKSAEADLNVELYEKVVQEKTMQSGSIYFQRKGSETEMGAVFTKPSLKYLRFAGGKGDMYDAVAKKVTSFNAGENKARAESFLTLGFGGSGKDLQQQWTVTVQGTETIDGTATTKLDLVPKDPSVAAMFSHVTVWLDLTRGTSLKQIFYTPEGDTRTSYFTHIRYNTTVDTKKYKH